MKIAVRQPFNMMSVLLIPLGFLAACATEGRIETVTAASVTGFVFPRPNSVPERVLLISVE